MRRFVLSAAAVVAMTAAAHAAPINPGLSGSTQFDGWETPHIISAANPGYGSFASPAAWPAPIGSASAGSGDAGLMKVAGGANPASFSIYFGSFDGGPILGGTLSIKDLTPVANLKNVVFQVDIGTAEGLTFFNDVLPALNYNGGTQALAPTVAGIVNKVSAGTMSTPGGEVEIFRDTWLLQWDLGALGAITDFDVRFSGVAHTQVYGLRLDQSDTFAAVAVPEPASLGLLAVGASALLARRKRR